MYTTYVVYYTQRAADPKNQKSWDYNYNWL